MKNYKVVATRKFRDSNEIDPMTYSKKERQQGDEFLCTKERYEFLKSNGAVTLVEIIDEIIDNVVEEVVESKEIKKVINNTVDKVVDKLFEEKPKKKKSSKR